MDELAVRAVKNGLASYKTNIVFTSNDNAKDVFRIAVMRNPAIIYYISHCGVSSRNNTHTISVGYENTDVPIADIGIAFSLDKCLSLMCSAVSSYKKKLVVVTKGEYRSADAVKFFSEQFSSFFSNLVSIGSMYYLWGEGYSVYEFSFRYRIGYVKLAQMEMEVDKEVERLSKVFFSKDMPVSVKILIAHNYLSKTVKYKNKAENKLLKSYTQSAYGALIKKECVCQGFAEAFKRIMDEENIKCWVIYGQNKGSTTYHAWNIVSLTNRDRDCYHIDVTWDASDNKPDYTYFCKNDSFFTGKRTWRKEFFPICVGTSPVLRTAKQYIDNNRSALIKAGIPPELLEI